MITPAGGGPEDATIMNYRKRLRMQRTEDEDEKDEERRSDRNYEITMALNSRK